MKRKLLCIFVILALLLNLTSFLIFAEEVSPYDEHVWSENKDVICGTYDKKFIWWLDVSTGSCGIKGQGTLENVRNLQKYNSILKSIIIEDTFSKIGEDSLAELSMCEVIIPESITVIGSGAFRRCVNLYNITFSDKLDTIDSSAFYGCSAIEDIIIPESVTYIGKEAFANCSSLKEVYIYSESVVIDSGAFDSCPKLKTVKFYGNNIDIKEGNERFEGLIETKFIDIALPVLSSLLLTAAIIVIAVLCIRKSGKNLGK